MGVYTRGITRVLGLYCYVSDSSMSYAYVLFFAYILFFIKVMDFGISWKQIWSKLRKDSRGEVRAALCNFLSIGSETDLEISDVRYFSFFPVISKARWDAFSGSQNDVHPATLDFFIR